MTERKFIHLLGYFTLALVVGGLLLTGTASAQEALETKVESNKQKADGLVARVAVLEASDSDQAQRLANAEQALLDALVRLAALEDTPSDSAPLIVPPTCSTVGWPITALSKVYVQTNTAGAVMWNNINQVVVVTGSTVQIKANVNGTDLILAQGFASTMDAEQCVHEMLAQL